MAADDSFFFEKNIHSFFLKILNQKTSSTITVQLLQTLSILFENIQTETSICTPRRPAKNPAGTVRAGLTSGRGGRSPPCGRRRADYLLSNNYVNQIICHKFDFSDEEILAYYISFLKTLSLKLNKNTIHFFYNEVREAPLPPATSGRRLAVGRPLTTSSRLLPTRGRARLTAPERLPAVHGGHQVLQP